MKSPPAVCGELYRQPGDEPAGRAHVNDEGTHFELDGGIALPLNGGYRQYVGRKMTLGIRPEHFSAKLAGRRWYSAADGHAGDFRCR